MKPGMNGSKKFNHLLELLKELWEKVKKRRDEGRIAYLLYRTVIFKQRNNQGSS